MITSDTIKSYFAGYAAAVAQSRALISVEDGLKPSLRMALYANYTDKYVNPNKTAKFLKLIGSASRFCWHGDAATYGMLVRSGKPYALRYPLYDIQGSYGTLMDPDSHGAPRYVEGRISKIGRNFFSFLEKDTIEEWRDNYDNTEKFPALLPSIGFWNVCNGTTGIGSGVAASIPQFNLKEMNTALIHMIRGEEYELPLPDFATGGILMNRDEVERSLRDGFGTSCKLRARIKYDDKNRTFIVTEMPYATYTNTVCKQLEELMQDAENGIDSFIDTTGQTPDIEIRLTAKADPAKVLDLLYAKTSLQNNFSINLVMLENCRIPKIYTLPEAMEAHIEHERKCYRKAFEYDRAKTEDRLHILAGYLKVFARIEEVIEVIKKSKSKEDAANQLVANFELDKVQAQAVLKLTLSRIASLEVSKVEQEYKELTKLLQHINDILSNSQLLDEEVIKGLQAVMNEFGDGRRTELLNVEVEEPEKLIYFTASGKCSLAPSKKEPTIATLICGLPYIGITSKGVVYRSDEVPKRAKKVFQLAADEELLAVYADDPNVYLCMLSQNHFRCRKLSDLNKFKTSFSIGDILFCGISPQPAIKSNYRKLCEQEQ